MAEKAPDGQSVGRFRLSGFRVRDALRAQIGGSSAAGEDLGAACLCSAKSPTKSHVVSELGNQAEFRFRSKPVQVLALFRCKFYIQFGKVCLAW
jgi:hypothetical protein